MGFVNILIMKFSQIKIIFAVPNELKIHLKKYDYGKKCKQELFNKKVPNEKESKKKRSQ